MAFPVGAETVLLTGHVELVDGQAWREPIVLTMSPPEVVSTFYNDIVDNEPIAVVPDRGTGNWSVRVLATDALHYVPSGWTYRVERGDRAPYSISLPAATPTVDLADLTPVSADPGTYDLLVPLADLGGAALLDVGTTTGTVAAGDDSRFGRIGPVTVTGTPSTGKVPTATGATTATWQTPASGGGGGSTITTRTARITNDNLGGLPSAASWTKALTSAGTPMQCSIPAVAGDRIEVEGGFMRAGSHFLDWVLLDSAGAIAVYAGSGTGSPLAEGNPAMYPSLSFSYVPGAEAFTVGAGHIDGSGNVTVALAHQGTGSGTVYAHTTYPFKERLRNIGPEPA